MYRPLINLALLSTVLFSGTTDAHSESVQNTQEAAKYFRDSLSYTANPASMKNAIKNKDKKIVIVDVRKHEHYAAGHVPGAINLPFDEWNTFDGSKVDFTKLDKTKMHYIYCYEAYCNLATRAALLFAENNYQAKEIKGGFKSYKDHKYPIE